MSVSGKRSWRPTVKEDALHRVGSKPTGVPRLDCRSMSQIIQKAAGYIQALQKADVYIQILWKADAYIQILQKADAYIQIIQKAGAYIQIT